MDKMFGFAICVARFVVESCAAKVRTEIRCMMEGKGPKMFGCSRVLSASSTKATTAGTHHSAKHNMQCLSNTV
jgi:hypothetical protein